MCEGPLVWFDAPEHEVILECAACGVIVVGSGHELPRDHYDAPLLREGVD